MIAAAELTSASGTARSGFALDAFAATHPSAAETIAPAGGAGDPFSYRFIRLLNEIVLQRRPDLAFIALLKSLAAIIVRQPEDAISSALWDAIVADSRRASTMRLSRGEVRSAWGVTPIHSIIDMARIDQRLGVRAETLVFTTYHTKTAFDVNLTEHEQQIFAVEGGSTHVAFRWTVFAWALLRYDVFHFYNDRGIIEPAGGYGAGTFGIAPAELELLHAADKRLYAYAYGADHRTRRKTLASDRFNFCMACPEPGKFCVCDDEAGERMLAAIRASATRVIGTGLSMDMIAGAKNLYYLPLDVDALTARPMRPQTGPLRVGHFPNHGFFKGTAHLVEAIEQLRSEGVAIELDMIGGVPREEVIERMRGVDVVVDQLISGAFGLTGLEAMALGRPVVCHLRAGVQVASLDDCPVIRANPDTIKDVLAGLVQDRARLLDVAARSRTYVVQNYSIERLTLRLAELYAESAAFPAALTDAILAKSQKERLRPIEWLFQQVHFGSIVRRVAGALRRP